MHVVILYLPNTVLPQVYEWTWRLLINANASSDCAGTEGSVSEQLLVPRVVVPGFPVSGAERERRRPSQLPRPLLVAIDTVGNSEVQQDRLRLNVEAQSQVRDSQRLALSATSYDKPSQSL